MRRALVVLALVALAACAKKKPAPAVAAKPEAAAPVPASAAGHAMTGPRQPGVISRVAPIVVDEAAGLLPAPAGARVLAAVAHAAIGQRIEGAWCIDSGPLAELGAALVAQYAAAGWTEVALHPDPSGAERSTLTARKPPYALYGMLERSPRADCRGVDGKTYVALGMHHVEAIAPPGPVGAPGATGIRIH